MNLPTRLQLVVLSAGLGICVFPPVGWYGLAVVAWIPLLFALRGMKASHALYLGILHGALFYGVTLSWLVNVFKGSETAVVPLVLILALFTGLFARGYSLAWRHYRRANRAWLIPLFAACWWLGLEFFRCEIFTLKFPWMSPGVGLGPMWISSWLGVYGMSFVLILGSALLLHKGRSRITGACLLAMMLVSALVPKSAPQIHDPIKVMAVQSELTDLDYYQMLTEAETSEVDLIVWPEYGIPMDVRAYKNEWAKLLDLAKKRDAVMVVGTQTKEDKDRWHNTALSLDGEGEIGVHYKNHTVHFFDDGVAGTKTKAVSGKLGKWGTPICFDCDYSDVVRGMTEDGAEFFAIPSMDAEHWSAREHYQHAELFRHRAAENGRWLVVASTSGVTQIIAPNGKRVTSIPLMEDGVLLGEIGRDDHLTFYTRIGWLFPWIVMAIGAVWVVVLFFQFMFEHQRRKKRGRSVR